MSSGYKFTTRSQLDTAVSFWLLDDRSATITYGDINTWDVSEIESFRGLFQGRVDFNSDISNWDVSRGNNFQQMFYF